jgi:hypothetical protein
MAVNGRPAAASKSANVISSLKKTFPFTARCLSLLVSAFLISCGGGGSGNGSTSGSGGGGIISSGPAPAVNILPQQAMLGVNQSQSFSVTVQNSSNTTVSWQVNSIPGGNPTIGTISASGAYTAPASIPNPATVQVMVVLQANTSASAAAAVTIIPPIFLTPALTSSLTTSETLQMEANGPNIGNNSVNWSVDNVPGETPRSARSHQPDFTRPRLPRGCTPSRQW